MNSGYGLITFAAFSARAFHLKNRGLSVFSPCFEAGEGDRPSKNELLSRRFERLAVVQLPSVGPNAYEGRFRRFGVVRRRFVTPSVAGQRQIHQQAVKTGKDKTIRKCLSFIDGIVLRALIRLMLVAAGRDKAHEAKVIDRKSLYECFIETNIPYNKSDLKYYTPCSELA